MPSESVKITCSTEDLDAKLSKSMKALGAHHDQYGRLLNANNQMIAGLSQSRIKMGDWIDSLGRARDAQGNYLDGLSATELKLRMYKDELGNVYNAEGELVRVSEELARAQREQLAAAEAEAAKQAAEAAKRQEELATAGQRGMQSLMGGAKGAAKMANNLSMMIGVLGGGNEGLTRFGQNVVIATQAFSQFSLAMKTIPKFVQGFKLLTVATQGQTAAQVILNAVSGNWVALVAGGLAAGTLAYKTLSSSTKKASDATQELGTQYERLNKVLQEYNMRLTVANAAQVGMLGSADTELDEIDAAYAKMDQLQQEKIKLQEDLEKAKKAGWGSGEGKIREQKEKNFQEIEQASAEIASSVDRLMAKDMPVQTELDKLRDRAAYYSKIIDEGKYEGEALANVQKVLAENQRKQAELVKKEADEKAAADKQKAEQEKAEAEKKLADAQRKLGDKFDDYAKGSPLWTAQEKAAHDLEDTIAAWRENFAAAGKSEAQLNAAIDTLKEEYRRKQLQEFMDANNLKVREDQKLTAEEEYTNTLRRIKEAEEQYGLDAVEAEKLRSQAEKDYADAIKKRADEEDQKRESRLSELGITSLREQAKTPWEKYLEQQQKVNQAAKEGLISAAEAQKLNATLAQDFYKNNVGEPGAYEPEEAVEEKTEEYKRASTMTAGSNELYQAMTQRESSTERYQTDVKKNLTDVARYTEDNYDALQAIQSQLGDVMRAIGVV